MTRTIGFTLFAVFAAALASAPAIAQKPAAKAPVCPACQPCDCPCANEAPPPAALERTQAACGDGLDNDGDGHVDCADQDCEIYAVCVGGGDPVAPVAGGDAQASGTDAQPPGGDARPAKSYTTMRQLKADLRAHVISGAEFWRWQQVIRALRAAEIEAARADLREGRITRDQYRVRVTTIRAKYEG